MAKSVWRPVLAVITAVNVAGLVYSLVNGEILHGVVHAILAIGFGLWSASMRPYRAEPEQSSIEDARLRMLEAEMGTLQTELTETRDRLDFTEKLLDKRPAPPADPLRYAPREPDKPGEDV